MVVLSHVYSEYSLLQSTNRIDSFVRKAKAFGYEAIALTDHHVMYGVVPFYEACLKYSMKPIIGLEVTIAIGNERALLRVYARNENGYRHLLELATILGHKEEKTASVTLDELSPLLSDVAVVIPWENGPFHPHLSRGDVDEALKLWTSWQTSFPNEHSFLELRAHLDEKERSALRRFSREAGLPLLASHPCFFTEESDFDAFRAAKAIRAGVRIEQLPREEKEETYFLHRPEALAAMFANERDALFNAHELALRCDVTIPLGEMILPSYEETGGRSADEKLRELCIAGAKRRYGEITAEIQHRLDRELAVITKMGFSDYFLIVWDVVEYARKKNMLTGPGRGSVAGSLVAYVLAITDVDPLKYELLFERFLNEERVTMPDIDLDFPDHRRDEIIDYVYRKYGKEHVAQIITFGTLGARAVVRDVGRVFGIEQGLVEKVANVLPQSSSTPLKEVFATNERLRNEIGRSERLKRLWSIALKLEGLPRHVSTHAAGVVISKKPLTSIVALQKGQTDVSLTQAAMNDVEKLGLLKFDFLGLRNLSLLERMIALIEKHNGRKLDLSSLPLDDEKTFALLSRGETTGIFQLESPGMRRVLRDLRPSQFEDIVAVNALFRPGPMKYIQAYIDGKFARRKVVYPHRDLEPILKKTYGVIVYQEQIMQIATKLSGFSLAQADLLRRAISKKDREELLERKADFIRGAIENGYERRIAEEVFTLIERFADYGFNRSHAVAYSMISYRLAYIKAHYPFIFYASLLSNVWNDREKLLHHIRECRRQGYKILPPSIAKSDALFTIEGEAIRCGLLPIAHVGYQAVREIVRVRSERPFTSFFNFLLRVDAKKVTRKVVEQLVKAGAFDEFGIDRASLLASLDEQIERAAEVKRFQQQTEGLFTLDVQEPIATEAEPMTSVKKLALEKEVLGFHVSAHPIERYEKELARLNRVTIIRALSEPTARVRLAGLITDVRRIRTVNGENMAFARLFDETLDVELVFFPSIWREISFQINETELYYVDAMMEERNGRKQAVVTGIVPLQSALEGENVLFIRVRPGAPLNEVKSVLISCRGSTPVILYYEQTKKTKRLPRSYDVAATDECLESLKAIVGEENVVLKKIVLVGK